MMKPKAALVKDGFLPAGSENTRGRLSGAAIERCKVLAAQGWDIEGYRVSTDPVQMESAGAMAAQVEKVKVQTGVKEIADIGEPRRDEKSWTAYANVNGKVQSVGMRTVCNLCHNSITYCACKSPVVNMGHLPGVDPSITAVVNFKPHD